MSGGRPEEPLRLAVLIGSTRQGRVGDRIAHWFADVAGLRSEFDVDTVDLADYIFPADLPAQPTADMAAFTGRIDRADAYAVVTPEYNRSFPASLKQAIDFGYDEWQAKPAGFVGYGCHSRGMYAVEALRGVFTELHVATMRTSVGIDLLDDPGPDGPPFDTTALDHAARGLLDQLAWWGYALRAARADHPYVS